MSKKSAVRYSVLALVTATLAAAILFPAFAGTNCGPAYGTVCLSNIKQVDLGMLMYAGDFDELLPDRDWSLQLRPYLMHSDIETCPLVRTEKNKNGYALSLPAAGIDITKVKDPAMEVTLFETDALGPGIIANLAARNDDRHNGKSGVGYLDGHAKSIAKGAPLKGAP